MLKAVRKHTDCPWVLLYIERWLKVPVQMEDGSIVLTRSPSNYSRRKPLAASESANALLRHNTMGRPSHQFGQAIERQLHGRREEKQKHRSLAEIVRDGSPNSVLHVVREVGFHKCVQAVRQRQQLGVKPAQPTESVRVKIRVDHPHDHNRRGKQHDM